jgi:hypothetical protein
VLKTNDNITLDELNKNIDDAIAKHGVGFIALNPERPFTKDAAGYTIGYTLHNRPELVVMNCESAEKVAYIINHFDEEFRKEPDWLDTTRVVGRDTAQLNVGDEIFDVRPVTHDEVKHIALNVFWRYEGKRPFSFLLIEPRVTH